MYDTITPETLKEKLLKNFMEAGWNTEEGSAADLLAGPVAVELWKRYRQDLSIPSMLYVDETSGEYIDKAAGVFGLVRKEGTKAEAEMALQGDAGTVIPAGTAFLTPDGIAFRLDRPVTLDEEGKGTGTVTATEVGEASNVAAGELSRMYTSLQGLVTWHNGPAVGGSDPESDKALVSRFYQYIQSPRTSSNLHDYEQWALSVDGVGYVKVSPHTPEPGYVRVVVAGADGGEVGDETVNQVTKVIEDPVTGQCVGSAVSVEKAVAKPVSISANMTLESGASLDTVQEDFSEAVRAYFKSTIFQSSLVLYNRILTILLSMEGVIDAEDLRVNGAALNLTVSDLEIPTLEAVSLTRTVTG